MTKTQPVNCDWSIDEKYSLSREWNSRSRVQDSMSLEWNFMSGLSYVSAGERK